MSLSAVRIASGAGSSSPVRTEASFRAMNRTRLLELVTPELKTPPDAVWDSLAKLDQYRQQFPAAPPQLTNAILVGGLLSPLGVLDRGPRDRGAREKPDKITFGMLPVARRDLERLRHVTQILPRLLEPELPPRVTRSLPNRTAFDDTLLWMEIYGDPAVTGDALTKWKQAKSQKTGAPDARSGDRPRRRRRRRRRRPAAAKKTDGKE